jgi:hypothetical protein
MPFSPPWADAVWHTVHSSLGHEGINCLRSDIMQEKIVLQDIIKGITQSELLIADVSGANANVFYEVGIAHAWERDVLMIGQKGMRLPFDIASIRHFMYDPSEDGLIKLGFFLRQIARERNQSDIVASGIEISEVESDSPTKNFLGQWEGFWEGSKPGLLPHTLVVHEIQEGRASVVYFSGNLREWGVKAGYRHTFGSIIGSELFVEWPQATMPLQRKMPQVKIIYALQGDELIGVRTDEGGTFRCRLRNVRKR